MLKDNGSPQILVFQNFTGINISAGPVLDVHCLFGRPLFVRGGRASLFAELGVLV